MLKILELYLELLYINGEISMFLILVEYEVKNRGFKIEIRDWKKGIEN